MSDEPEESSLADEQIIEPMETEEVTETEAQTTEQPTQTTPEWSSRYRSPEDMWQDVKKFQGEAQRYKNIVSNYQPQQPPPPDREKLTKEQLDELVADPDKFVDKRVQDKLLPILEMVVLQEFRSTHEDYDQVKDSMRDVINKNPEILRTEEGLEMAYLYAKNKTQGQKMAHAAQVKTQQNAQIQQTKQTTAFVEGATTPKQKASPKVVPGMSIEEQDKILDDMGVPWITEEERNREFE